MVARAFTVAFEGVDARMVEVQCAVTPGMPNFALVGLPDKAVSEAKERVRAALNSMAIALPSKRITINLSPADLPKEGSHFDLPIALALLAELEIIPKDDLADPWQRGVAVVRRTFQRPQRESVRGHCLPSGKGGAESARSSSSRWTFDCVAVM